MHPNQLSDWKTQFQEKSSQVFGNAPAKLANPDIKTMQAKIGQLTLENDFLENALTKAGLPSARRGLTAPTTCRSFGNARFCVWRGRPLTTPRNRPHPPISPSCKASTNCICTPFCRQPDALRSAPTGRPASRKKACTDADEENGRRRSLPEAESLQTTRCPSDLPLSAQGLGNQSPE